MNDPRLVPLPVAFPSSCALCGSSHGPVVDTGVERPGIGHVYLCTKLCVPALARVAGLAEGERMTKILDAKEGLEQAERELERRNEIIVELREQIGRDGGLIRTREAELETERGKVALFTAIASSISDTAKQLAAAIEEAQALQVSDVFPDGEPDPAEPATVRGPLARVLTRRNDEDGS